MGRASKWLKSLFSGSNGRKKEPTCNQLPEKKKLGWSFSGRKGSSYREKPASCHFPNDPARSALGGEEESKRAIAVAAATAAVAEAAVAAAEAAAVVVRLTSRGRRCDRRGEVWAAVRIQAVFRGYLARRALKALKGIVKIQALVRGYIVRKQAAETLRCMQALVRAQERVRAGRVLADAQVPSKTSTRHHHDSSKTERGESRNRVRNTNVEKPSMLKRNHSRTKNHGSVDDKSLQSPGLNWLDRWMDVRYSDNRENGKEKILEVDAGRPHINPKWRNRHHSICSTTPLDHNGHGLAASPDSPSKDSTIVQHSVMSFSSVEMQQHSSSPLGFPYDGDSFYSSCSRLEGLRSGPFTPSKSECACSLQSGFSEHPNYMMNTESSRAKARSHSAPRQRPEFEKLGSVKRNLAQGYGTVSQPFSSSQRSFYQQLQFAGKDYPGSGRLDRMGEPTKV